MIEEGGKALILVSHVASLVKVRVRRDGGGARRDRQRAFAAFESAGYALRGAMIQYTDDHPLLNVLQTEAERAVRGSARRGHVGGAIFGVGMEHGPVAAPAAGSTWYGCAIRISEGLGREGWVLGWPQRHVVGSPTGSDLLHFQIVYDVMVGIVGLIGLVWAVRRWRRYRIDRWTEAHPRQAPAPGRIGGAVLITLANRETEMPDGPAAA